MVILNVQGPTDQMKRTQLTLDHDYHPRNK
jgi:hypothetical protein